MSIYHQYDIRGVYPDELDEKTTERIGRAFVTLFKSRQVLVGADTRVSSPRLKAALIRGLTAQGCDVTDIGLCSTPLIYYVSKEHDAIMITASHNPPQYNGLKLCRKGCKVIGYTDGIDRMAKLVERNVWPGAKRRGRVKRKDYKKEYVRFLRERKTKDQRALKVVMDAGNGMAGMMAPLVFKRFPLKVIPLYFRLDGRFPNHIPNPILEKNIKAIKRKVKTSKADLGMAFDADIDRIRFIDERGRAIESDVILALFADHFIKKGAKAIVADVTCGKAVKDATRGRAKLITSKVGHTNMAQTMKKHKAIVGGERSGHFYFKYNKYCDNAMLAAITLLNILSKTDKPLSQVIAPYNRYHSRQINLKIKDKAKALAKLKKRYPRSQRTDGISVHFKDWWFNARPSNTEPLLRLTIEASSKEELKQRAAQLTRYLTHR